MKKRYQNFCLDGKLSFNLKKNNMRRYHGELKVHRRDFDVIPEQAIEKEAIFRMLSEMPIELLKKLINFKKYDPYEMHQEDCFTYKEKERLKSEGTVLYSASFEIEDDFASSHREYINEVIKQSSFDF